MFFLKTGWKEPMDNHRRARISTSENPTRAAINPTLFSVKDKVVIVTGASRGIGRVVAEAFLDHGSRVVFVARSSDIVERIRQEPTERALAIQCDVATPGAAPQICDATVSKFERIDVLMNNAAISLPEEDPYAEETWDRTLNVNLRSVFLLSRAVIPVMKQQGRGSIINITSVGALLAFPGNPSYQAAKGGLRQLTKAMARDYAQDNIRVNNICPGYVRTAMTSASWADPAMRALRSNRIMMGRWGEPKDFIGPCIFLASEASAYITGCDLPVDGGWTANGI